MAVVRDIIPNFFKGLFESFRGIPSLFYLEDQNIRRISPTRANSLRQRQRRSTTPVTQIKETRRSKVIKRISQCLMLGAICFAVIIPTYMYIFSPVWQIILALLKSYDYSTFLWSCYLVCWFLGEIFSILWIVPFFLLTKIINIFLFQDIADCVYTPTRGPRRQGTTLPDLVCSIGVQCIFILQIHLMSFIPIPILPNVSKMFLYSLLCSQYVFEYKWINMGLDLSTRLNFIECEWPYFLGFGLPMYFCSEYHESFIISSLVFSVLFPFFIISANAANPPIHSRNIMIPVFYPTMYLMNLIIRLFSKSNTRNPTYHIQQNR